MKTRLYTMLLLALVMMTGCNKDGDDILLRGFGASQLTATATDVVLQPSNNAKMVLSLVWDNPDLLTSDSSKTAPANLITNYMQVSVSADFATVQQETMTSLSKAYLGADLNKLAKDLGLSEGQAGTLYFRIMSSEGANMEPAYSNVCKVNVTPFTIHMNSLSVLNSAKTDTITHLYSPTENGVYTGFMHATAWLNCWFLENDGTIWGNAPVDGHAFEISTASDAWNCWFADGGGDWQVTVDTKAQTWSAANIKAVTLNGEAMTYDSKTQTWSLLLRDVAANTALKASASAWLYDATTRTDTYKEETLQLADTTLTAAGTYTVELSIGSDAQYHFTVTEGEKKPDEPTVVFPSKLYMYTTDGTTLLATMEQKGKGIYTCQYTPKQWENFKFIDMENNVWYGSDPNDLFTLSSDGSAWNIWFKDDFTEGKQFTITANLNTMKWSYE